MGAKSRLLFLLVASLIGIGFALIPATEAETPHRIEKIAHQDAKIENIISIFVNNEIDKEIPYSLTLDIFSEDLQENIDLESSNHVFSINGIQTYNANFTFTIPSSGNYLFNITLLSNDDGQISTYSIENEYLFYETTSTNLEDTITDYYLDENDHANWIYDANEDYISLINIENEYNTGIVLGPYDTLGKKENTLNISTFFEKAESTQYSISYCKDFNSEQLYSTIWTEIYSLNDDSPNNLEIDIEEESNIYLRILAIDSENNPSSYWNIANIKHKYVTIKHQLKINHDEHYFFNIDELPEIKINLENTGKFNQQIGNISIAINLYSDSELIETYTSSPNLLSNEMQNVTFRLPDLEAGNHYCSIQVLLIDENVYYWEDIILISISGTNLGDVLPLVSSFEKLNLLIETDDISTLEYETINLVKNYYIIPIVSENEITILQGDFRLISAISMDQNKFKIVAEEESQDTVEGILAPLVIFEDFKGYNTKVNIKNEGFYSESYQISYFFASAFIQSVEGAQSITLDAGKNADIEISLVPHSKVPREGGSQLRVEISDQYETKAITYILSYSATNIEITEQKCNKHSLLLGQEIICSSSILNKGYTSNSLSVDIIVTSNNEERQIIDQINIDELRNGESVVIQTTYFPKTDANFRIGIEINSEGTLLNSKEIKENINVVSATDEQETSINTISTPEIKLTHSVLAISFAGMVFQFSRSENFRYLTFKFFIPLYSRLQKDTLADEPTRQKLLSTIYTEPGANFTLLKEKLGLHNGTLAHHINILENNDMITSHRSGRQRLFFPFGGVLNNKLRSSLITNQTQKDIITIVKDNPGITQSMVSRNLNVSRQKVNYHVNCLSNESVIKVEKQGRITRLYPMHFT